MKLKTVNESCRTQITPVSKPIRSKTAIKDANQSNNDMLIMMRQRLIKNLTARDENKSTKVTWELGAGVR